MNDLIKHGAYSIVLGKNHYQEFLPEKTNKLLKITNINERHNEFKYLDIVRTIDNYSNYYSIPDETSYLIKPSDKFYNNLKKLVKNKHMNIFYGSLQCFYIDYAGDKELLDTICHLRNYGDFSFWNSYKMILHFTKTIMDGLNYLHQKKICHLDVKSENIMVNTRTHYFKLIDFGFSSIEPFDDYVHDIRGTPGYFPKYFENEVITPWLPKIKANDMEPVNGELPMITNRTLVYKIDSYCFGRVLYFLKYVYDNNYNYTCSCFNNHNKNNNIRVKLNKIIASLLHNDVNQRITIQHCLDKYLI